LSLAQLAQLESAQLVRPTGDEEGAYLFKHALTWDAAYQSLLVKQRRRIHRLVAQAYQAEYAPRCLDEFAAILAHHYAEAGDDEQALVYATRAGDAAAHLYANTEAIAFYTQAIEIARRQSDNTAQLIHLYTRRGRAFELMADYDRAIGNYREMQTFARTRGDRALELESLILQTTAYVVGPGKRDWHTAQTLSAEALALARELADLPAEARIYWNLLLINRFGNEGASKAIEYGEKSLALARKLNLKEQVALTLKDLAVAYVTVGRIEIVRNNLPETLALWRELDNQPMLAEVLGSAVPAHLAAGELEQAIEAGEESLALNQSIGNRYGLIITTSFLWYVYRERGQIQRAIELAEESIALGGELGFLGPEWGAGVELADTFIYLGAPARAEEYAKSALATVDAFPSRRAGFPSAVLAHLQLQRGDRVTAEQVLAPFPFETLRMEDYTLTTPIAPLTIVSVHIELALAQDRADRADSMADDLVAFLNRIRLSYLIPSALHFKAKAQRALGRADQAYALLTEARRQVEALQSRYRLWPILSTLLEMEMERGDAAQAERVRGQAREVIEYIADHTPAPYRESFLNLPAVRTVMQG
jgi:tetratricopeptide (TPR) repeat protein